MSKWTKGPWRREYGSIRSPNGETLLVSGASVATPISWKTEETEANGNLMFAAPDLYEALEYCIDCLGDEFALPIDCIEQARAALAKARGE